MDNYYLNNAVYLVEDVPEADQNPPYGGEVDYGDRAEHCWNGDQKLPTPSRACVTTRMYVPKILARIAGHRAAGRRPDELEILTTRSTTL